MQLKGRMGLVWERVERTLGRRGLLPQALRACDRAAWAPGLRLPKVGWLPAKHSLC